ncbi:MAG: nitroreductase, partial [Prevotella sp.]|nr:nitroreductase [Prevotella sp.]
NYFVMAGRKADDLDYRIGYYGEQLVLLAQTLGLNTCWVGLSYSKIPGTYVLNEGETIQAYIALGYGETQGVSHKIKTVEQVSNISDNTPEWFKRGVEAALLAPTAVNQQKFSFEYVGHVNGHHQVHAKKVFSLIGFTQMDLGIAKYHFEIGAGKENFEWV